jgi:general secretion pathway protein C
MIAMSNPENGTENRFLSGGLPKLVNVLLIVPLSFGFSKIAEQFLPDSKHSAGLNSFQQFTSIPASQNISLINSQEIANWHLFGKEELKKAPVKPKKVAAPLTKLNLTLRGIAAGGEKFEGLAIIQQPNKEEKHFKVGDNVFNLAKLGAIHTNRVILVRNGQYETLRLPKLDSRSKQTTRTPVANKRKTTVKKVTRAQPIKVENKFWEYLDYEPAIVNGKVAGLKLNPEEREDEAALVSHGLMPGDVITSVNGHEMKNGLGVSKAINAIAEDDKLEFVLTRKGATMNVVVNK